MKIANMGPTDMHILQLIERDLDISAARDTGGKQVVGRVGKASQVSLAAEAHKLQRVATLAEQSNELQAEKLQRLKGQIEQGTYHIEAADVAKGIARSAISRLLDKGCCTPSPS
jgi:flagellar biosynthesis anti-sigma factor FlgM